LPLTERFISQLHSVLDKVNLYLDIHSPAPVAVWYDVVIASLEPHLRDEEYPSSALLTKAGNVEFGRGKRDKAMRYYALAMKQSELELNVEMSAVVGINLAHLYIAEEKYDMALRVAEQSVALATEHACTEPRACGFLAAGLALKRLAQMPQSHQMFTAACRTANENGLDYLEIRSLMHLSWYDYESGMLDDAILKLRRALDLCALTGNTVDQLRAYFNLGLIQADQRDFPSALRSLVRAREIRDSNNLEYGNQKIERAISAIEKDLQAMEPGL
jgi:tetratricopeptide (TPR) repeat protein